MKYKKELVAQRVDGKNFFTTFLLNLLLTPFTALGAVATGLPASLLIDAVNGPASFMHSDGPGSVILGAAAVCHLGIISHVNRGCLYEVKYDGQEIGKKEIKKYLTWKGKVSLLPIVGKMIDPQDILSDDAPYIYVKYESWSDKQTKLDMAVKPIDAWDKLMEKETGIKVSSEISYMKKVKERNARMASIGSTYGLSNYRNSCDCSYDFDECLCDMMDFEEDEI